MQKYNWDSNPFGQTVISRKTAKANKRFYDKINPALKTYFGNALKKKVTGTFGGMKGVQFKGILITYYDARLKVKY